MSRPGRGLGWLALLVPAGATAQTPQPATRLDGFVDFYYAFDFNRPLDRNRAFTTQPLRHNEFNVNLALLRARYTGERARANVTLATGTYVQANYAAEPQLLQHILEAWGGIALGSKTWLDAGVLPSHIGFESTVSASDWTVSRSLMADYSPFFETGARLTVQASTKLTAAVLVLNGWQNIHETNNAKSVGVQLTYQASPKLLLNYSNYIGNEAADAEGSTLPPRQLRYFQDTYAQITASDHVSVAGVFDFGTQERPSGGNAQWYGAALLGHVTLSPTWAAGLRAEYFHDPDQVVVSTGGANGFVTSGGSVNLDHSPSSNVLLRVEARLFGSDARVWPGHNGPGRRDGFLLSSLAITL